MKGRLHLPDITNKYKKRIELSIDSEKVENWSNQDNNDDLNENIKFLTQKIQMYETEIVIYSNLIRKNFTKSSQNDVAAIAAVDYAIKERKPTCGFAMEFKMAFKV